MKNKFIILYGLKYCFYNFYRKEYNNIYYPNGNINQYTYIKCEYTCYNSSSNKEIGSEFKINSVYWFPKNNWTVGSKYLICG